MSMVTKPIRNYNIESRAHKIISKDKPVPAPKHKSISVDYERILKGKFNLFCSCIIRLILEYPNIAEEIETKHKDLDSRLRDVFVVSHDPVVCFVEIMLFISE